jgi:hypothetical protein
MSKSGVTVLLISVVALMLGFSYVMMEALISVEKAATETMETYCGPETAKRFKLRDCERSQDAFDSHVQ